MNPQEISKTYNAPLWEDKLYSEWERSGFFNPDVCLEKKITDETRPRFSMVLPPPNVTGILHAGSAVMLAIQDTLARYHRMKGERTLWLPGTDHAAVATQSKVEKILWREEKKSRHDLGREEFLERVHKFAKDSHDTIINQCKKMGASLDWSREAYTLDEPRSLAVRTAFKKMYDDGLIYRGYRVVNWSVKGQSTLSDDEVVGVERPAKLYTFRYSKDFPIPIATTRPETKLGDTAVAVHPADERYEKYLGKEFTIEVGAEKPLQIKIIGDESVDPAFGTGAVGVTPAHSHADFEMREKHPGIGLIQVIGPDGKMTAAAGENYAGLTTLQAREKFVARLREENLLEKEEDITQNVGISDRYEDVLEVLPMLQWFVAVNKEFERGGRKTTLKTLMREAVTSGNVTILPERFAKTYFRWIENLRDWCISRQIWFGHRIPVWYCRARDKSQCQIECKKPIVSIEPPSQCPVCGSKDLDQDPDTLDTWFSSGLWTFSTLGWPDYSETAEAGKLGPENDFANYHPTNLLETGYDILFFWVARMILMTEYLLGVHPFDTVYLHGLVRDGQGRKMSKSLDNIIDLGTVTEKYGADALRLALISGNTPGQDLKLSDEKIVSMRNFVNKLWNMARYVGSQETNNRQQETKNNRQTMENFEVKTDADKYLMWKLSAIAQDTARHLERYELSLAAEALREFTWGDFADWYVEIHKIEKNDALLCFAFDIILKLWHPFAPFVTEAIHRTFHFDTSEFLMVAHFPTNIGMDEKDEAASAFQQLRELITAIRNARSILRIAPAKKLVASIARESENIIRDNEEIFKHLARLSEVKSLDENKTAQNTFLIQAGQLKVFLHLEGIADLAKERARFQQEKAGKEKYIASLEVKLSNKNFLERAKPEIVSAEKKRLEEMKRQLAELEKHLKLLG